jgi:hypothetical protein
MMVRSEHTKPSPTLRLTGDTSVTGSLEIHVSSFKGSTDKTPYEVMTGAAGWTNTASGDVPTVGMSINYDASSAQVGGGGAAGASQTCTFAFVHFSKIDIAYADGLLSIKAEFTDFENAPTIV